MRKFYLWLICLGIAGQMFGQSTANYTFSSATNGSLTDMSSGTTDLLATGTYKDDAASAVTNIGFDFVFMGTVYNQFSANSNGQMRLGIDAIAGANQSPTASTALIAPISGDNSIQSTGKVHYKVTGSLPSQILIVEWVDLRIPFASETGATYCKFQALLYEASGKIEFRYGRMYNMGTSAQSRGIYFASGTSTGQIGEIRTITTTPAYTNNQTSLSLTALTNSSDITNLNSTADGSRTIYTFTPPAAPTAPSSLTFTNVASSTMTLNWTDNATTETSYGIFRSTDGVNYTFITSLPINTQTYNATGLSPNTSYSWKVAAINEGNASYVSGSQATNACMSISGIKTVGSGGDFPNLTIAFAELNACGIAASTILELKTTYTSASETFPLVLNNVSGTSATSTLTLRPATGSTNLLIEGSDANNIIRLNGTNYFTIDGQPGGVGGTKQLIISNTNTGAAAATISLFNDASNNTIKYCDIKGVSISTGSSALTNATGVVAFGTTTGTTGNDNNTITYCDIHSGASKPFNCIFAHGTSGLQNNNNTVSYCNIYDFLTNNSLYESRGIYIGSYNTDWTITNNKFYQTSSISYTGKQYGIEINSSTGNNFTITNNTIGFSNSSGTGIYTISNAAPVSSIFVGIKLTTGTSTASSVQGNSISNILINNTNNGTPFIGIHLTSQGCANIGTTTGNIIGNQSSVDNIKVVSTSTQTIAGILVDGSCTLIDIINNQIGGLSLEATTGGTIKGISIATNGGNPILTISNNIIGSASTSNSIRAGLSNAANTSIYGISTENSASCTSVGIDNNSVVNLIANGTGVSGKLFGIYLNGSVTGVATISGNQTYNLFSYSGTSASVNLAGIYTGDINAQQLITQNTIYSIANLNASSVTSVAGLRVGAGIGYIGNIVSRNLIYNLSLAATTLGANTKIIGIQHGTVQFIFKNNMIRLGYDQNGAAITKEYIINGIEQNGGDAEYYFNSIYIGGTGVGTTTTYNTAAFYRSSNNNLLINNNIFVNERANSTVGGKHYAMCIYDITLGSNKLTGIDYNIYRASGTGGVLFNKTVSGAVDYNSLQAWRYELRTGFGDMHSGIADPKFINPTAATPDLHIQTGVPTPVEASGIAIATITEDFDGDVRSNLTPTDIGADAAIFNSMDDKFTPNITYTALTNGSATCSTTRTLTATVTDVGTGVPTSGANVPRIWYSKNSTGTWYSRPGTLTSGNGNNGVWSFTITYSDMGGVVLNDVVKYYVDAQDQATTPNIWYTLFEAATPLHSSVTTQTTPPANPNNFSFVAGFSGTYYIPSGTYKSLSCNNVGEGASPGIFQAINSGVLTGDVTIIIDGNITETGTNSLNQWIEDCGSLWKVTIRPNSAVERLVSGDNSSLTNGLINFNSPDRVLVDGSFNGAGQYLRFRNINTSGVTMNFANNCVNDTVRNCFIEGNSTSASRGVLSVASGATISDACNHLYFENNDIRDLTSAAGYPNLGIYINTAYTNNITFKNNRIYNWVRQGITANSVGDSIILDGNHLYTSQTYSTQKGIQIYRDNSVDGKAHTIKNNYIGGQAANCGGSALLNSTSGSTFYGIDVSIGNSLPTTIEGNVIKNITMNQATVTNFYGIYVGAGQTSTGLVEVKNNIIGGSTAKITTAGTGNYHGIDIQSQNPNSLVQGNTISYIENSNAGMPKLNGVKINVANIKQNKIYKLGTTVSSGANIFGINLNTLTNQSYEVSNNQVSLDGGSASNPNYLIGIYNQANSSGTISCMYNTCYIYGTASSTNNSYPYYRSNVGNIAPVINNILVNDRSGGTGAHLAIGSQSTSNWNSNYNLLVSKSSTVVGRWSTTNYDLSNWKSNSSSDYSSWYAVSNATSDYANINIANLFVDAANGNLNINTANPEAWFVFGKGIAGASSGNISTDFAGNVRGTTSGYGTCIGAHQFSQPAVAPIAANQNGTLSAGNTTTYTFGNRTICAIDWTAGTAPTAMDVKYYSGCDEPNKEAGNNYHNYYVKCTPTGGSGYTYTMNLRFDQAFTGDLPTITDTRLAKYSSSWYYAADNAPSSVASAEYILTTAGLTSFSSFTGSKKVSALPIDLVDFSGTRSEKDATLRWTTATEINNNYFELLRSVDMQKFEIVATVAGAGNSNNQRSYSNIDVIPFEMKDKTMYYKLKQVDFDGKSTISNIITLVPIINTSNNSIENIWINASQELNLNYFSTNNSTITLQLIDASGKIIVGSLFNTKEGINELIIPLPQNITSGLYLVRIVDGVDSKTKKIIIK